MAYACPLRNVHNTVYLLLWVRLKHRCFTLEPSYHRQRKSEVQENKLCIRSIITYWSFSDISDVKGANNGYCVRKNHSVQIQKPLSHHLPSVVLQRLGVAISLWCYMRKGILSVYTYNLLHIQKLSEAERSRR